MDVDKPTMYDPYELVEELFPIHRTIAGPGIKRTLELIKNYLPELQIKSVRSGKRVWDWTVPDEWSIESAWIEDLDGRKIIDYKENNLRVVGFSIPVDRTISHSELLEHLHFLEDQPSAIPYVTSYYSQNWGFCIRHDELEKFDLENYRVVINSKFKKGHLRYGEIILEGESKKEVLFSTNICHPSMANNELSGPAVLVGLVKFLQTEKNMKYTYRIIFIPETIGALAFLKKNLRNLKRNCIAGLVATCLGDRGNFSYIPSPSGTTLSDKVAKYILAGCNAKYYGWSDRGSDERQFCWPTINLPICSITRSKYREYSQYHTSLDDLDFVNRAQLQESIEKYIEFCRVIELNKKYVNTNFGEPQLSKRKLYAEISKIGSTSSGVKFLDIMNLTDGMHDLIDIAIALNRPFDDIAHDIQVLRQFKLVKEKR
jgi:aminopeptidase-like protein